MKGLKIKNWEFGLFVSNFILMGILAWGLGNPRIPNTSLCWHHIPEFIGLYCMGGWLCLNKIPLYVVLTIFCLSVFFTPIFLGTLSFVGFIISLIIGFPLPLGFLIWSKYGEK